MMSGPSQLEFPNERAVSNLQAVLDVTMSVQQLVVTVTKHTEIRFYIWAAGMQAGRNK